MSEEIKINESELRNDALPEVTLDVKGENPIDFLERTFGMTVTESDDMPEDDVLDESCLIKFA